jgi:lantibiotic modifying enzyme
VGKLGYQSWISFGLGKDPIIGMSHGAAGFAYALSALAEASGRKEFAAAAMECLAFEDDNYNSEEQYWPDLRKDLNDAPVLCSWCHGATGIGLARIGSLRFGLNQGDLHQDIQRAISYATKTWPQRRDSLCCGSLGSVEFLKEAGKLFEDAKIKSLAEKRLIEVLAARKRNGDYDWQVEGSQWNLGLFKGISGVGYTILRHLNPSLPNVLIWE